MIRKWLKETSSITKYQFKIIDVKEEGEKNDELLCYLAKTLLFSYRDELFLKRLFKGRSPDFIKKYIKQYVFPANAPQITKNVRQGDFGEIISTELIEKIRKLNVPFCKLKWKMNKDKSVFCTDILSHNYGDIIEEINYYEVKTRITSCNNVCIEAHNSLLKDIPTQPIADYLQRLYYNKAEEIKSLDIKKAEEYYKLSEKYSDIVINNEKYKKNFEIILVIENSKFDDKLLELLENLPPEVSPLTVTIIKISKLKDLFEKVFELAQKEGVLLEHGKK